MLAIVVAHHFNYELKSRKSVEFWSTFPIYQKGFPNLNPPTVFLRVLQLPNSSPAFSRLLVNLKNHPGGFHYMFSIRIRWKVSRSVSRSRTWPKKRQFFDEKYPIFGLTPIPCVPTGSGDFPSNSNRKKIVKAAGMVFQIYEEPRKSEITDLEQQNTKEKKELGVEVGKVKIFHEKSWFFVGKSFSSKLYLFDEL